MAKKKSFSIGSSLTQALMDTVSAARNYAGELNIEIIPLRKIDIDPDNPREFLLSLIDLYEGIQPEDPLYSKKQREIQSLHSLANSIKLQGIINPIVVYKLGGNYKLVAGERRTLASILAGKADIPARILSEKPNLLKLSLLQWIENIEREDLTLNERITNLSKIISAYASAENKAVENVTPTEISKLLGCSLQQAINYKNVLQASENLQRAIASNQIKNIEKAAFIAKSPEDLESILISSCIKGASLAQLKSITLSSSTPQSHLSIKETRGRQTTKINFGSTDKLGVAKTIITSLLKEPNLNHLDKQLSFIKWDDYRSVTKAFRVIVTYLEQLN